MHRALLAVVFIAGCRGGDRAPPQPSTTEPVAPAATPAPVTRSLDAPPARPAAATKPRRISEELLEPGRGRRQTLRYRLAPVARATTATATITSDSYDEGFREPVALAPVREGFEVTPGADGAVRLRGLVAEIVTAGQSPAAIAASEAYLTRWRSLLERQRAELTVDDRGQLGAVTLQADPAGTTSADAADELVQRWLGLAVPLPEPAIGVGARWKIVTTLRSGGAMVTQTATYRLAKVERDRWTIAVELHRLGKPQRIAGLELPSGAYAELMGLVRNVTGTVTVSPGSPLPIAGELAAEVRSHARFTAPGQAVARDQYSEDRATVTLTSSP